MATESMCELEPLDHCSWMEDLVTSVDITLVGATGTGIENTFCFIYIEFTLFSRYYYSSWNILKIYQENCVIFPECIAHRSFYSKFKLTCIVAY